MLKVFAVLFCTIAVPTFAQDLLDDYDPQAVKGISMRCWNNLKEREVEFRLKSDGLYMNNVLKEVDERRGNVVAAKRQYSEWLVTTIIFDFDERIEVMTTEYAEGVSEEDVRDRLLSLGYTDFEELLSTVGKPQVTDCR